MVARTSSNGGGRGGYGRGAPTLKAVAANDSPDATHARKRPDLRRSARDDEAPGGESEDMSESGETLPRSANISDNGTILYPDIHPTSGRVSR